MAQCPKCGAMLSAGYRLCPQCGTRLNAPAPTSPLPPVGLQSRNPPTAASGFLLAGFWRRVAAFLIDLLLLVPLSLLVQMEMLPILGGVITWWLYFSLFESSPWQATLGKRLVGLKVTDVNGVHLRFGRATARFFAKPLSGAILGIGFLLAAFTPNKQTLHDLIAGTLVLQR